MVDKGGCEAVNSNYTDLIKLSSVADVDVGSTFLAACYTHIHGGCVSISGPMGGSHKGSS